MNDSIKKFQLIKIVLMASVIGVAAGVVGTLMTDKNKRKQIFDTVEELKKWSDQKIDELKKKVEDLKIEVDKKFRTIEEKKTELQDLKNE
jgi:peptidoglycan hydrolase CwlO-like protein